MSANLDLRDCECHAACGSLDVLDYRELPAALGLREAIACYWQIAGRTRHGSTVQHRVLPDACVDIIFDLAAWRARCVAAPGRIVGTMTRAARFAFAGGVDLLGIRLRPGGAFRVGGHSLRELTDTGTTADDWLGPSAAALTDELAAIATFEGRALALDRCLRNLSPPRPLDRTVIRAQHLLAADDGTEGRVREVALALGLGERQLQRRFVDATGLTPATFRRVLRFRRLLRIRPAMASWADAAAEAGYFDQAHMAHEFERLAGVTPAAWSIEQRQVGFLQDAAVTLR